MIKEQILPIVNDEKTKLVKNMGLHRKYLVAYIKVNRKTNS